MPIAAPGSSVEAAISRPYTRYALSDTPNAPVRTFLIADIRGSTRFTEEHGDEASAGLAEKFASLVQAGWRSEAGS